MALIGAEDQLWGELWVSLASLLRSYTAVHGLNGNRQALVELGEEIILVRHGDDWLKLSRTGARIDWRRADGSSGLLEFTEAGRLRPVSAEEAPQEEEMDMMAEAWARELML